MFENQIGDIGVIKLGISLSKSNKLSQFRFSII